MKKTIFSVFILMFAIISFWGCRKGPDDPWFSIHSRKARVVGDWKVTTYVVNDSDKILYTQTGVLPAGLCGNANFSNTITNGITFSFKKDGSFEEQLKNSVATTVTYSIQGAGCTDINTTQDTVINIKGSWMFSGGTDRTKYKELLTTFNENTRLSETFDITYLANKQIRLEQESTDTAGYFTKITYILDKQ